MAEALSAAAKKDLKQWHLELQADRQNAKGKDDLIRLGGASCSVFSMYLSTQTSAISLLRTQLTINFRRKCREEEVGGPKGRD